MTVLANRRIRRAGLFMLILLLIEFVDELVFGTFGAAMPFIRADLSLTYAQIGLLLTIPALFATLVEPFFGILANHVRWRRQLMIGGGVGFTIAITAAALAGGFSTLLASFLVFFPASGAFVSISQAALMDTDPRRHEQNMARWTLAGSLAIVAAPLLLSGIIALGGTWRTALLFISLLAAAALALLVALRRQIGAHNPEPFDPAGGMFGMLYGLRDALAEARRPDVLRWLLLLQASDLMLDVLYGFLALYLVDVVALDESDAAAAIALWTGVGIVGDFALLPLLERVRGLAYLRVSAAMNIILYPLFLLSDSLILKLVALALLGFFNAGWYSVLQAQVYTALPGKSGTALTLGTIFGFIGSLLPVIVGAAAAHFGLDAAMWLMLAGPLALLMGIPPQRNWRSRAVDLDSGERLFGEP